jgi:transposase
VARIVEAIGRWRSGALSCVEAAEVLGMSERQFRRLRDRYEADGAEGLIDRRRGRMSGRRVPVDRIEWLLEQYRTRYFDFTAQHFHERLQAEHRFELGYTWTKLRLQEAGLIQKAPRRSAHRKKRPRRPLPGMLLFQDGSTHPWLAGRPPLDLIVTLDDATSEIYAAFLVEQEGTFSSLRGLAAVIGRHGLFCSLYTDRGSHYFVTPKAGGVVARDQLTQVGRALEQLGIEHIPSYSPEARGRMERVFGTLQNRLPQALRRAGIGSVEAANRFLAEAFVAEHNARFAVKAAEPGSAFVAYAGDLAEVLCVQVERMVGNDNCVRYEGRCLQIPPQRHRHHFVKVKVRVHAYEDGRLAVFHGPRCLARYEPDGRLAEESIQPAA